ncbi:unnamed protein product, partial [Sphagnum compactum]
MPFLSLLLLLLLLKKKKKHEETFYAGGGVSSLSLSGSIDVSQTLVSQPHGVFQLGFYSLQQSNTSSAGGADAAAAAYALAIWYSQVVPTTPVWMASRDVLLSSSAYLQLSADGVLRLFLSPHNHQAVWQSSNKKPTTTTVKLEDTGNFVLKDAATNTIHWRSFDTPTDTLLPGQKFSASMSTWTGASITNWNRSSWSSTSVSDRNATVYPYWWFDAYPADYAYLGADGTTFYLVNASGEWPNLTSTSDQGQGALTRMTLDRDGGFRLYSFTAGSTGWVVEGSLLPDPCEVFATCGVFAICSENITYPSYISTCTCPMGFVPISVTDPHQGCTAEFQFLDDQYCINDTSSKVELVEVGDIDYPFSDRLSNYLTMNETACKQTCMEDCRCAGAVFHRREQICFLKGTPLFNGGYTVQEGNRSAYLKVLTSPLAPSQGAGIVNVRIRLVAGICAAAAAVVLFLCGLMCLIGYRRHVISKAVRSKSFMRFDTLGLGPRNFTYKGLNVATRNFSDSELLGRGGMGSVYRGVLRPENVVVAVKRIRDESKKGEQGFLAEATSISQIRHRNLVQLQGWCYEDRNLLLVYDFMSNGSLDQWLYNNTHKAVAEGKAAAGTSSSSSSNKNTKVLSWELRYSILSGVAAALAYLHEECQQCVLHRDIKPSNVMLDEKFEPHLGDFGLARLIDHQKVDKTTMMAGTLGYMAPEMPYTGKATKETDVYSFGILVLEVVCGRHPLEPSNADIPPEDVMLVNKVRRAHEAGKLLSVVDSRIETVSCNVKMRVLQLGLLCSLQEPTARPSMRAVSQILSSSSYTTSTSRDQAVAAHETTLMALPPLPPTFSLSHSADLTDLSAILCSIELQTQSSTTSRKRMARGGVRPTFNHLGMGPRKFTYKELSTATRNFSDTEMVGSGGMGTVYKGVLQQPGVDGSSTTTVVVAVKRLRYDAEALQTGSSEQGFVTEASSISQIRHRNLVQLQGWCYEDTHLLLVYDFMVNGSLDHWLYERNRRPAARSASCNDQRSKYARGLSWELRYSILSGVAAALAYLHEEWQQCVLHRDIKPSNVMLDAEFNAHLGDFGLARLVDHQKVEKTTMMAGTLGYMAPEMPYTGKATKETDVYSFGVLVLEVVCGRHPVDTTSLEIEPEDALLVNRVRRAHDAGKLLSVQEICIESEQKSLVLRLGLLCSLPQPSARPSMRVVKHVLSSGD